jgi:4-hydroxy-3-methylbut-2-en-1-yl diphosphate synthase IspG/GcpE
MQSIKNAIAWFIFSSKDSMSFSLTLKSSVGYVITAITMYLGLAHIPLPIGLTEAGDAVIGFMLSLSDLAFKAGMAYGAIRKVYTSFKGTNKVINNAPAV